MTTRKAVVAEAMTWLHTPYHHQGRIKGAGVDCAMILCEVYEAVGLVPHIDPRPYPPDWHLHKSEERYLGWVEKYAHPVASPKPGDIALFKFGRCISHAGIVIEWPLMIHSYLREGVVTVNGDNGILIDRQAGFYSLFED